MNPYRVSTPCVISFSGGRTSGYMLYHILQAFGGTLPPDVVVIFCNTGKERPETLDFVERVSQRWSVPITWLEYFAELSGKFRKRDGKPLWKHTYKVVDYVTASRNGEPFDIAIRMRGFLPNPTMRFCTGELKIKTTNRFVRQSLGWLTYHNTIGFRADEPDRVFNLRHAERKKVNNPHLFREMDEEEEVDEKPNWKVVPGETPLCPLYAAGVTSDDVLRFWGGKTSTCNCSPTKATAMGVSSRGHANCCGFFAIVPTWPNGGRTGKRESSLKVEQDRAKPLGFARIGQAIVNSR